MKEWSIATRLFAGHLLFMLLLTSVLSVVFFLDSRDRLYAQAADRMTAVASTVADNPLVLAAAKEPNPSAALQPYAVKVMADAPADFVTIMAPDRTRWTHKFPDEIGKAYIGTVAPALAGKTFTETTAGTLGPSIRTIVPVKDADGTVRAMVAAGVTVTTVDIALNARLPEILGIALVLLVGGFIGAWLLGRYLRRVTFGRGPEELGRLFAYYQAAIHSSRDGLLLVDDGRVAVYNDVAATLLGLPAKPPAMPPKVSELQIPEDVAQLLLAGTPVRDQLVAVGARVIVLSQEDASVPRTRKGVNRRRTTVATIADHTELMTLGDELQATRTLALALRSQTHEHANRIHTLVSLIEMGRTDDALDLATADVQLGQQLTDNVVGSVAEPVLAALLMGKTAQARERGVDLRIVTAGTDLSVGLPAHQLVTIVGNLIDNALDAAAGGSNGWVEVSLHGADGWLNVQVRDSGSGARDLAQLTQPGYTTKPSSGWGRGLGLALVQQHVESLGGTLTLSPDHDGGACFAVRLPLPGLALPAPSSAAPHSEAQRGGSDHDR